jgi:hypothetical protein
MLMPHGVLCVCVCVFFFGVGFCGFHCLFLMRGKA